MAGKTYLDPTTYVYFINPCAPLTKVASTPALQALLNNCTSNSSVDANACQMPITPSSYFPKYMGVASSLQVEDDFYELWMDGGVGNAPSSCRGGYARQTVIRFYCGPSIVRYGIVLI